MISHTLLVSALKEADSYASRIRMEHGKKDNFFYTAIIDDNTKQTIREFVYEPNHYEQVELLAEEKYKVKAKKIIEYLETKRE